MGCYERFILPRLMDLAMGSEMLRERRAALIPQAQGSVIEIGIGSGRNLPLYTSGVERLYGIDPSAELIAMARRRAGDLRLPVELVCQRAEQLPFADGSFDTAVMTWTLCSIPEPERALRELHRTLKPGGRLLFVEHGRAPEPKVALWQRRLTLVWRRFAGGCHLDRKIDALIRGAGFAIPRIDNFYLPVPRPFGYLYEGMALK